jgi:hypothetical protein
VVWQTILAAVLAKHPEAEPLFEGVSVRTEGRLLYVTFPSDNQFRKAVRTRRHIQKVIVEYGLDVTYTPILWSDGDAEEFYHTVLAVFEATECPDQS